MTQQPKTICPEKLRLVEEHNQAAIAYNHATIALNQMRGGCSVLEYRQLKLAVEEARIKSQNAGLAVTRHTTEHGC